MGAVATGLIFADLIEHEVIAALIAGLSAVVVAVITQARRLQQGVSGLRRENRDQHDDVAASLTYFRAEVMRRLDHQDERLDELTRIAHENRGRIDGLRERK